MPPQTQTLTDERLRELLLTWDEARERGEEIGVEALCRETPEVADEVRRLIDALRDWDRLGDPAAASAPDGAGPGAEPAHRPPESPAVSLPLGALRLHARGGLGAIYEALQMDLPRSVALKYLVGTPDPDRQAENWRRFILEARITARLEHPGIVPVYGLGRDAAGRPCCAMRFIRGSTLRVAIRDHHDARARRTRRNRLAPARDPAFRALLGRFRSACVTVAYAHSQGILHRDLKPDNIMLGPFDATLVVDWGLAKDLSESPGAAGSDESRADPEPAPAAGDETGEDEIRTQGGIGTIGFASPEQQAGELARVGPASDVFSLGATLYVLLTGRPAFEGKTVGEVAAAVDRGDVVRPRAIVREVPRALEAVCLKALRPRPEDRYAAVLNLVADLEAWLADRPVSARPDPWTTRAWRWANRHRTAVVALAATLFVGLAFGGILWRNLSVQAVQRKNLAYVHAEKAAGELVLRRRPEWTWRGLDRIGEASRIETPLRSPATLRALAVECLSGIDLKERVRLTGINSACLAFRPDGRRLAVGEHHGEPDYRVQVFDLADGRLAAEYLIRGGPDTKRTGVSALAYSRDGRWLAAGLRSGAILVWDADTPGHSPVSLKGHADKIMGLAFTPDGATLVSGSQEGLVRLWDVKAEWREELAYRRKDTLACLSLGPDGTSLACGFDHSGLVFSLAELRKDPDTPRTEYREKGWHHQLWLGPAGQTLAVVGSGHEIRVVGRTGAPRMEEVLKDPDLGTSHADDVDHLEYSPDGTLIVSGSTDNTLKIWEVATLRLVCKVAVLTESVVHPAFRPDGRILAVATSEGTTLYDVLGSRVMTTGGFRPQPFHAFAFTSDTDATTFAATTYALDTATEHFEESLGVWGADAIRARSDVGISVQVRISRPSLGLAAHPGLPLIAHSGSYRLSLRDANRGDVIRSLPEPLVSAPCFSRDGQRLWGVIDEVRVASWSVPGLERRTTWEDEERDGLPGRVGIPCLAAGRDWVVAGSRSGRVYLLRASDGTLRRTLEAGGSVESIALSPDESLVACGTVKGVVALFRLADGARIAEVPAHQDIVTSVAFDPAGGILATASRDRTAALWGLGKSAPAELIRISSPSGRPILSVQFHSRDPILGMLVQGEHAVRLWHLDRLRARLRELELDW